MTAAIDKVRCSGATDISVIKPVWREHVRMVQLLVTPDPDGGFTSCVADLDGVHGEGKTIGAAVKSVTEALNLVLETYVSCGMPIPWNHSDLIATGSKANAKLAVNITVNIPQPE